MTKYDFDDHPGSELCCFSIIVTIGRDGKYL
jgi:hypothetical protein